MKTVAEILRWRSRRHPERLAVWHRGRELTYAELDRRASRVANALVRAGLRPGERVCFLDKTHDAAFETVFGIAKAGGVFTPVNWRLAPPEIAYVVNDAQAPIVFVGEEYAAIFAKLRPDLAKVRTVVRYGAGPDDFTPYAAFRDTAPDADPGLDTSEDETVWQLYTSGTTGHPKGTELTHRNLVGAISTGLSGFGDVREGDVGLVVAPLYHIGGAGYALVLLFGGCTLVANREFDPGEILRVVPERRVNHAFLVPAMLLFLLSHPDCAKTDFASLQTIVYGASPIPEDLLKRSIETFGCQFVQAYGLTETTGAVSLLAPEDHVPGSPRLRSCGRPVFGAAIRVVDAEGCERPPGQVGEIVVRGDQVMKGYWGLPDATAQAMRDGWFRSGDAGYFDADGYLYIHDRVKDMIVSGGENVYPAEVESVLFSHPAVADVAVIGVPDERWGEAVKAVVVRRAGAEVGEAALLEWCQGRIAGYKRPRSVDFVDALPRNPTGKLLKRELREKYWAGRSRRVN
jgi:acyl-CoA synthetase (AMP-forming)/AMP-acid ligase II